MIRLILQGTVDNNLCTNCLVGIKALDHDYCRQPTLWLHELCLEAIATRAAKIEAKNP